MKLIFWKWQLWTMLVTPNLLPYVATMELAFKLDVPYFIFFFVLFFLLSFWREKATFYCFTGLVSLELELDGLYAIWSKRNVILFQLHSIPTSLVNAFTVQVLWTFLMSALVGYSLYQRKHQWHFSDVLRVFKGNRVSLHWSAQCWANRNF